MYMTLGILTGGVSIGRALLILLLSYLTNYLGTAAVAGLTVYYGGLFQNAPYSTYVQNLATSKVISPSFGTLVARAVPANVLVNIAVLMASSAEDIMSKTFGVYIAIGTFVMAGSEHLIANEFYIHAAMFNGAHVGYGVWIWKSVIAVTIGNIIGAFIVGFSYWYIYKAQERLGENHWLITGWPSRKKSEDEEEMGDAKSSTKPSSMETKPSSMETKPTESTRQHSRDKSDKSQQ